MHYYFGENGVITKARDSEIISRAAQVEEKVQLFKLGNEAKRKIGEPEDDIDGLITQLQNEELIKADELNTTTGTITIGDKVIVFKDIYSHIAIGDIVYYDPTAGVESPTTNPLLRYESKKGSSKANEAAENVSGNGRQDQTFTATNTDTKWVVLYKKDGQLVLMSEDLKNPSQNASYGQFGMERSNRILICRTRTT